MLYLFNKHAFYSCSNKKFSIDADKKRDYINNIWNRNLLPYQNQS